MSNHSLYGTDFILLEATEPEKKALLVYELFRLLLESWSLDKNPPDRISGLSYERVRNSLEAFTRDLSVQSSVLDLCKVGSDGSCPAEEAFLRAESIPRCNGPFFFYEREGESESDRLALAMKMAQKAGVHVGVLNIEHLMNVAKQAISNVK